MSHVFCEKFQSSVALLPGKARSAPRKRSAAHAISAHLSQNMILVHCLFAWHCLKITTKIDK